MCYPVYPPLNIQQRNDINNRFFIRVYSPVCFDSLLQKLNGTAYFHPGFSTAADHSFFSVKRVTVLQWSPKSFRALVRKNVIIITGPACACKSQRIPYFHHSGTFLHILLAESPYTS